MMQPPEPSTSYFPWPDEDAPTPAELSRRLGVEIELLAPDPEDDALWTGVAGAVSVRVQPKRCFPPMLRPKSQVWWGEGEQARVHAARWSVGLEEPLDPERPRLSYRDHLRRVLRLCPDLPALYDASSELLRTGLETRELAQAPVGVPAGELFTVQIVCDPRGSEVWVHTHGLQRLARADVEVMCRLRRVGEAGDLAARAARLSVGGEPIGTGEPFRVAPRAEAAAVDLEDVLRRRAPDAIGGFRDRDDGQHDGRRVVLVDPGKKRARRVLRALSSGPPQVVAEDEERDLTEMAHARWDRFGLLFATHRDEEDASFQVKACFGSEHLWFEAHDVQRNRVRGRLVSDPLRPREAPKGDDVAIDLERVSDWLVLAGGREVGPWTPGEP